MRVPGSGSGQCGSPTGCGSGDKKEPEPGAVVRVQPDQCGTAPDPEPAFVRIVYRTSDLRISPYFRSILFLYH
jgi:hypothetical protein